MPSDITRIEAKLDKVIDTQAEHSATLRVQAQQLKEHMRRSDLNEEAVKILRSEVKPVIRAHQRWQGAKGLAKAVGAVAGGVAALAGVVEAVLHVLGHVK
jgi:hypothetical protein